MPPGNFDPKFTMVANHANTVAAQFNEFFSGGLPGPVPYRVELTAPHGPSTGGGKQALQHIRLVPEGGDGTAIVIGSLNSVERAAEIRSYRLLADLHAKRFKGAPFPVEAESYEGLAAAFHTFFQAQAFTITMMEVSPSMAPPPQEETRSSAGFVGIGLVLLAALLAGGTLVYFVLYGR